MNGAGTSYSPLSYQYRDRNVTGGIVYYRIRQIDFNGDFNDSEIIAVSMDAGGNEVIHLNTSLSNDIFYARVYSPAAGDYLYQIKDVDGKTIASATTTLGKGINNLQIDMSAIGSGVYFFNLRNKNTDSESSTQKFVKL